jgi:hypothetical protein
MSTGRYLIAEDIPPNIIQRRRQRHIAVSLSYIHELAELEQVSSQMASNLALLLTYYNRPSDPNWLLPNEHVEYTIARSLYPNTLGAEVYLLTVTTHTKEPTDEHR